MSVLPEIDSRFDVLAKLGEGGMGCVYKVRHRDLDEVQIVKTLQAHLSTNEALKERFINEARRGMRLRHPHIAGVHDFQICADGTGYIVMEYVHGHNLRDLLATRGPLPLQMVGAIAVQTLDALGYLHSEKFVHRDISPDNLMLETAGGQPFVKLIDLGISKSLESGQTMTGTGQFLGKLQYASPEQFSGQIDGRSDLYSLGVTLYKLLTNADAFVGDNVQLMTGHLLHPPRRFEEAAPDVAIPEAVQQVIYRALEKDPNNRYADAMEFCAAVEEAFDIHDARPLRVTRPARTETDRTPSTLTDKTVVSFTAPTLVPAAPTLVERRPRRLAITAALLAIAALAVAGFVVWQQRKQAAALARYGKFHAVVIGESEYRKYPTLPTAVDDARAVAQLLHDKYGFEVTPLENKNGKEIIAAIKAAKADNLLVFYAGHGELKNDKGYWLPVDADLEMTNWISPAMIRDVLLDHPARRTLLIADSCYSGSLARGALASPDKNDRTDKRSRMVISSGGTQPVIDSADGRHSIFTRALLEVLGDPARKVVDVEGIFAPIRDKVVDSARRAGREQKPELAVMAEVGDEGGTFFFVKR
ncbi:MAG: protein kinase [Acidobacteriota bacterium]